MSRTLDPLDPTIIRHGTLYFPTGNLVICSSGFDEDRTAFRVHTSVLATHSTTFGDLFSAQGLRRLARATYDGAPLIQTPDSAQAWEDLLGLIYNTSLLQHRRGDPENPERLHPVMSLAVKFNVPSVKDAITAKMLSEWPTSLTDWDNLEYDMAIYPTHAEGNPNPTRYDAIPEPAKAIRFAREYGHLIPGMSAVAFYALSCIDAEDNWDHFSEQDRARLRTAKWNVLGPEDDIQLTRGKDRLLPCWKSIVGEWPDVYYAIFAGSCTCSLARAKRVWDSAYARVCGSNDIILELKRLTHDEGAGLDEGACPTCHDLITQKLLESRTGLWGVIPQIF